MYFFLFLVRRLYLLPKIGFLKYTFDEKPVLCIGMFSHNFKK